MSEAEKKRRREYKATRKKRIMIFSLILCGLLLLTTVFGLIYHAKNRTLFVDYTETSYVGYSVKLFPNEYYEGEWQTSGQAYVADLTDTVKADFSYAIHPELQDVSYTYIYDVKATLVVADKATHTRIYHPEETLVNLTSVSAEGEDTLEETVLINYADYRLQAGKFIDAYQLSNVEAYVLVTLHVDTVGSRTDVSSGTHTSTLTLPLIDKTFTPESSASVPTSAAQQLACVASRGIVLFRVFTIVFGAFSFAGAVALILFIFLTRNHDINYAIKVKRLIATYKSFIQEITTPFASEGYQVVYIKSFNEMLEVRDTISAPLLMYENEDGTATSFSIPSNMGILYCYEIRVEDYNDIYGITEDGETDAVAPSECFVKTLWSKVCAFFRGLKKNKAEGGEAPEAEVIEPETEEATDAEATEEVVEAETTEEATEAEAVEEPATEAEVVEETADEAEETLPQA